MKTLATCEKCGGEFTYEKVSRVWRVCESCKKLAGSARVTKYRQPGQKLEDDRRMTYSSTLCLCSQANVARMLGVSEAVVEKDERIALVKLRKNRELTELWRQMGAEGIPPSRDVGEQILEWQMAVAEWWQIYAKISRDAPEEAVELKALIETFQARLWEVVNWKSKSREGQTQ